MRQVRFIDNAHSWGTTEVMDLEVHCKLWMPVPLSCGLEMGAKVLRALQRDTIPFCSIYTGTTVSAG